MKKVIAIISIVCVMCAAGAAIAQPKVNREQRNQQAINHPEFPGERRMPPCGFEGKRGHRGPIFAPDMPQEIREKAGELAKLRIDLEEALTSNPVNREKALEVYGKMQKIEQDIDLWRFTNKLDRIEEMRKIREMKRDTPPAPAPEKEKPEPEEEEK